MVLLNCMKEHIEKYQFKEGLPLEFEILDLNKPMREKNEMLTQSHRAQFYQLLWIEKGKGTHLIDFNPIEMEDDTLIFVPFNSVNRFDKDGLYEGKAVLFTDSFFCKNQQDVQFLHASMLFSDLYNVSKMKINPQHSQLHVFLNAMETEYQRQGDKSQYQMLHNMLHIFLLQAEREMRKQGFEELVPSANLDYLMRFKELLEAKFREEKSVNKYANALSISVKQLHKATTTLLEKTPKQIIDERVVLEAKRLLVHSNQSIKEIAYELGYDEPTNFIKYFRKHSNNTPSEFRVQF